MARTIFAIASLWQVNFGRVQFMEKVVRKLPISNIGQRIVEFEFIAKLDEKEVCQPWFVINPVMGLVMPGEVVEVGFFCPPPEELSMSDIGRP